MRSWNGRVWAVILNQKVFRTLKWKKAGLIKRDGERFYDRFRGGSHFRYSIARVEVIAFSGRILHDDGKSAKYLNSPETELFSKSRTLYGFDKAKLAIKKTGLFDIGRRSDGSHCVSPGRLCQYRGIIGNRAHKKSP